MTALLFSRWAILAKVPACRVAGSGIYQIKKQPSGCLCDPAGARTQDPILKRDVLYQLSY